MTLPADQTSADHTSADQYPAGAPPVPPPGCPAHQAARLHGGEAQADPAGLYERLRREHGPVAPVLLEGDVPAWLVLGYRENMEAARTPSRFSRDARIWRDWQEGRVGADSPLIPMLGWRPDCVSQDGEEHRRLRAAVNESLGRFDKHGVRRHIHRYANQLIDRFAPDGRADLLTKYAQHLPMLVLTRLFGMPEDIGPQLVEACTGLIKGGEKALAYNDFILGALRDLAARKSAEPGHDFASWLIAHPAGLTEEEVQNHLRLVLIAANETTTNLIANTLRVVLTDPRFRASLTGGLMTIPDAIEQVLWDEPPLMVCPGRFATGDMEFGGQPVKAGDLLVLGLAAGNTDPAVRPDLSTPVHGNRSHLAFSRGPHECPGQDIGRAITDGAVDALLARLPDIHLDVPDQDLRWTASTWSRHLDALPAVFTPRRQAAIVPAQRTTGELRSVNAPRPPIAQRTAMPTAPAQDGSPARQTAARSGWRALIGRLFGR